MVLLLYLISMICIVMLWLLYMELQSRCVFLWRNSVLQMLRRLRKNLQEDILQQRNVRLGAYRNKPPCQATYQRYFARTLVQSYKANF